MLVFKLEKHIRGKKTGKMSRFNHLITATAYQCYGGVVTGFNTGFQHWFYRFNNLLTWKFSQFLNPNYALKFFRLNTFIAEKNVQMNTLPQSLNSILLQMVKHEVKRKIFTAYFFQLSNLDTLIHLFSVMYKVQLC